MTKTESRTKTPDYPRDPLHLAATKYPNLPLRACCATILEGSDTSWIDTHDAYGAIPLNQLCSYCAVAWLRDQGPGQTRRLRHRRGTR